MGRGIAASFASAGIRTAVLSRDPAKAAGLHPDVAVIGELPTEAPELVIESVPEVFDMKLAFNARVEAAYAGGTVLGSNTSSLSLQKLADHLKHPERFCGIHYFQPADIGPVVELARVAQTSDVTFGLARTLLEASGKYVLQLNKPIDGLLINRLQHAILHEAYYLIEQGICTARDVDEAAKRMLGPRMSVTGLIEQKDLSGLDTHALAQAELVPRLHHGAAPSRVVQGKYAAGRLGVKSGTGFYDWRGQDLDSYRASTGALLGDVLRVLEGRRPAPPPLAPDDAQDQE
jgi:3-hydroxybutyryl-CoA dehydrogenase